MKRRSIFTRIALLAGLVFLFGGCSTGSGSADSSSSNSSAKDGPYNFYNQVSLSEEKEAIDADLGEGSDLGSGLYNYVDSETGFGVSVLYDSGNQVRIKSLYHDDTGQILALCEDVSVSEDQVDLITPGMSYQEVRELLGADGLELIEMKNPDDLHQVLKRYVWMNADGTGISVAILEDDQTVVNATYFSMTDTPAV